METGIRAKIDVEKPKVLVDDVARLNVVRHAVTLPNVQVQTTVHGRPSQQIRQHRHGQAIGIVASRSQTATNVVRLMNPFGP